MPPVRTPHQFAFDNVRLIRDRWSGVRDGDAESIHQARIATRRLRAALAIADGRTSDRIDLCRDLGRMLGAVREVDVTQELFTSLSTRLPEAGGAVAVMRRTVGVDQNRVRTHFVKTLEDVSLRPLATMRDRRGILRVAFGRDSRSRIAKAIGARYRALSEAADRTPAVYMPNRLHQVRIAMKKLRYTLEVASAAGMVIDAPIMRDLRKTQDLLGQIHDLGVARRMLQHADVSGKDLALEAKMLDAVLAADCAAFHKKYLARRERVRAICEYCEHLVAPPPATWTRRVARRALPAAGMAIVPLAVWRLNTAGSEVSSWSRRTATNTA
jgi:CHAD domain-containing protein